MFQESTLFLLALTFLYCLGVFVSDKKCFMWNIFCSFIIKKQPAPYKTNLKTIPNTLSFLCQIVSRETIWWGWCWIRSLGKVFDWWVVVMIEVCCVLIGFWIGCEVCVEKCFTWNIFISGCVIVFVSLWNLLCFYDGREIGICKNDGFYKKTIGAL